MTEIACREADGINIPQGNIEQIENKITIIKETLKKFNLDPSNFEISLFTSIAIVNDQAELEGLRKKRKIFKRNLKNLFIGTLEDIKEKVKEVEIMGISKIVLSIDKTKVEDSLEVFATEIIE